MERASEARAVAGTVEIRPLRLAEASAALAILREAAAWSARFGDPVWSPSQFTLDQQETVATAGELVGGFEASVLAACMHLQSRDDLYWPDDVVGEALYIHKVAVRRDAAGRGWLGRLIDHAAIQARVRGARVLRLDTLQRPAMVDLYIANGFRIVDVEAGLVDGRAKVRLERLLP